MITDNFEGLKKYVPDESHSILFKWFEQRPFVLKITKKRATKFGDFRAPFKKSAPAIISVNGNLNEYAFLITLTHEFAHHLIWLKHKSNVKAHGQEWKDEFSKLVGVLLKKNVFPNDIATALAAHMQNPAASSARDQNLVNALRKYDAPNEFIQVSELEIGTRFRLNGKRTFIRGEKKRTRYLCTEENTNKTYLIHGIAEVTKLA